MPKVSIGEKMRERLRAVREKCRTLSARLILLAVIIGLVCGLFFEIRSYAINLDYFIFDPQSLSLDGGPEWVSAEIEREVFGIPSLSRPFSLLEPDVARRIGCEMEQIPWVRKVHAVRKYFPKRLEIEMSLRKPFAWAKSRTTLYLVDAEGVRLPRTGKSYEKNAFDVPVITGMKEELPEVGRPWNDEGLRAGLSVVKLLDYAKHPGARRVARIDCKVNVAGAVDNVVVYTQGGAPIYWGKPAYAANSLELSRDKKLANLLGILEYYDDRRLAGFRYIDLRYYETPRAGRYGLVKKVD